MDLRPPASLVTRSWTNAAGNTLRTHPGPWQGEPDKLQWITAAGYDALAVRNGLGAWCGYVGVPPGHPCHGVAADDLTLDVHGGVTYTGPCLPEQPPEEGICHVPEPGRPDDLWWIGWDCVHYGDLIPAVAHIISVRSTGTYRSLPWVRTETEALAVQLLGRVDRRRRPLPHGTHSGYIRGCRCKDCRRGHAIYERARRGRS